MKRLAPELIRSIEDFVAESDLPLPAYALEKDFIVFDAIKLMTQMQPSPHFRLVFCGGTCLSKAYGILERMSEDVDFKLVPVHANLPGTSALRKQLSAYANSVVDALEAGGFGSGNITRRSLDGNRYTALDVRFTSAFERPESLRSHLLIEINHDQLSGETEQKSIAPLLSALLRVDYPGKVDLACVSLREALAEKLVAFPRRLASHLTKSPAAGRLDNDSGWDKALVRHLYDVHQIVKADPQTALDLEGLRRAVRMVIGKDARHFANQHPAFAAEPQKVLLDSLVWASASGELKVQYEKFAADMVYAPAVSVPRFHEALETFQSLLGAILTPRNAIAS